MNNSYPTVATILGCPKELQSADGLVATPIVLGINNEEMEDPKPSVQQLLPSDTSQIKDPIQKALVDNILGKLPTKTVQEKFKCFLCNVEVNCRPAYLTHLSGAKHAKRLKEEELKTEVESPHIKFIEESKMYHCTLCSTVLNAKIQISAHLQGTKHKNKAGIKDSNPAKSGPTKPNGNAAKTTNSSVKAVTSTANDSGNSVKPATPGSVQQMFCSTCNLHTNSDQQYQQHIASKKHLNKEKMKKGGGAVVRARYTPYNKPNYNRQFDYNRQHNNRSSRLPTYIQNYLSYKAQYFERASSPSRSMYPKRGILDKSYDLESRYDYLPGLYGHQSYRNHPDYNAYS